MIQSIASRVSVTAVPVDQVLVQLIDQQPHDPPQVVVGQRVEDDDFVDPVDELRVEGAPHFAEHHLVDARWTCAAADWNPWCPSSG